MLYCENHVAIVTRSGYLHHLLSKEGGGNSQRTLVRKDESFNNTSSDSQVNRYQLAHVPSSRSIRSRSPSPNSRCSIPANHTVDTTQLAPKERGRSRGRREGDPASIRLVAGPETIYLQDSNIRKRVQLRQMPLRVTSYRNTNATWEMAIQPMLKQMTLLI